MHLSYDFRQIPQRLTPILLSEASAVRRGIPSLFLAKCRYGFGMSLVFIFGFLFCATVTVIVLLGTALMVWLWVQVFKWAKRANKADSTGTMNRRGPGQ
jgi:hypothetical protein